MKRLNDNFISDYRDIKEQVADIKTKQFSGSSNVVAKVTETSNTWDINWTVTNDGGMMAQAQVEAAFTADDLEGAFTSMEVDILLNNQRYNSSMASSFIYMAFRHQQEPKAVDAAKQMIVGYVIQASLGDNIKMKFRATSIDTGSLSVKLNIQVGA